MKKIIPIIAITSLLNATNITTLFEGLKHHYKMQLDSVGIKSANLAKELVESQLYPKIDIFGSLTHYSLPNAIRPMPPSEASQRSKKHEPLLFSQNIARVGVNLSMPIFVKSIYTMSESAKYMQYSAKAKRKIDLLKDEATLVGAIANLQYLEHMRQTLKQKRATLKTTLKIVNQMVKSGRAPQSQKIKVLENLSSINIALNNIKIQKSNILALIKTLTGINIKHSVPLRKRGSLHYGEIIALKPLEYKANANRLKAKATAEKRLPSLFLKANYTKSYGKGYLSKKSVNTDFSSVSLNLKMPLLDMPLNKNIELSKLKYIKSKIEIKKTKEELLNQAKALKEQLKLLRENLKYSKDIIAKEKQLLKIAKATYEAQRLPIEEYLRYVNALYETKANYYKVKALYWQTFAKLAFIYGNDLENILR